MGRQCPQNQGADTALAELAASVAAMGLIHPLSVQNGRRRKFDVLAGRLGPAAYQLLARQRKINKDHPVPCVMLADDLDLTEISLAENAIREDMHPADQFEAFRQLADNGHSALNIAARFGCPETHVVRLLKPANVAPQIFAAFLEDQIDLKCVKAFAVTDDRAGQKKAWKGLAKYERSDS